MITPAQYQHQLADLKLDVLDKSLASKADAQAALPEIISVQEHLRQIEQGINMEIHVLRSQYQTRISAAESGGGSSRIMVSARRRVGGSQRANEEAHLVAERDGKLAPFNDLKGKIAGLLEKAVTARSAAEKLIM